jgi:hypothetical protein
MSTGVQIYDPKERFAEQVRNKIKLVGPSYFDTGMTPAEQAAYQQTLTAAGPLYSAGMSPEMRDYFYPNAEADAASAGSNIDIANPYAGLNFGGTGTGVSASDQLAARKYRDERADRAAQQSAIQNYLASGGVNAGYDRLAGALAQIAGAERGDVESSYARALQGIEGGYGEAQRLTGEGYDELVNYLARTASNPYAGMQVQAGLTTNPMEQFLQAYGAAGPEVQAQVAAEQASREGGAAAFRNLVDILSGASGEAQTSRQREAQMARNLATTTLGQQRAGMLSQAEVARQQALSAIAQRDAERQFAQQTAQLQAQKQLEQLLLELGVTPARQAVSASAAVRGSDPAQDVLELLGMGGYTAAV